MHGETSRSRAQRFTLTGVHLIAIAASGWLLLGGGFAQLGGWFDQRWVPGDATRRALVFACAVVYFMRLLFGTVYLLRRKMGWAEVGSVAPFVLVFHALFAFLAGGETSGFDTVDAVAIALYAGGSFLNTGSELMRHLWKRDPENEGKIYTRGLFSLSMHINYFGDSVLFTGYAMLTRSWWAGVIPVLMTLMFAFMHMPALDAYLAERYGSDFQTYAKKTKKLIPFVY